MTQKPPPPPPNPNEPEVVPGELLEGRWKLQEQIGQGGMGTVWRAQDVSMGRVVAVKILAPRHSRRPEFVERFLREARLLAQLDHPNIVTLFGAGRRMTQPFLVMRHLSGVPLRAILGNKLTVGQTLPVLDQVARGLGAMHARGVFHRDLKPGNLFVSETGHVTILDLGIAREADSRLTRTGVTCGTPGYMSPEQIVGDKALDARTDVYSLAVIAFELLTHEMPYGKKGDEYALLSAQIHEPPRRLTEVAPELPPSLDEVLLTAMARRPADRYQTAQAFVDAFRKALPTRKSVGTATLPKPAPPSADADTLEERFSTTTPVDPPRRS